MENPENGKIYRLFLYDTDTSNWKLGALFVDDAFKTDFNFINQQNIDIIVFTILMVLTITLYIIFFPFSK